MSHNASTTCLVIGGTGFVGSAVAQAARDAGWNVCAVGRSDYAQHVGERFDVVINANGNASRFRANQDPRFDFDASVRPVHASLHDFTFDHYVMLSTVDVYNDPARRECTAENAAIEPASLCVYGFHKWLAETLVRRQAGRWQILRLAQMVGPNLKKGPLFDVLERKPLWIHPQTRLHYMDTRQVGRTTVRLIEQAPANDVYNVCGRGNVEFSRVLELSDPSCRDVTYADTERQVYDINTDKTHAICPLPESWEQVSAFVSQVTAAAPSKT